MADWRLYIVRCGDRSLYTGITTDVERRVEQHARGDGARYLRGRGPLTILFTSEAMEHGDALRMERLVKALPKERKERLAAGETALFESLLAAMRAKRPRDEEDDDSTP